jgi:hypothetical protein
MPPDPIAVLSPVVDALERLEVRYHVGGSLASSAYGLPRATADVDLIAELRQEHVTTFIEQLQQAYYVDPDAVRDAIERRRSFNLIHLDTMLKVDVFVPADQPFEREELDRARPETLEPAQETRLFMLKSPEDLVLRKLDWYRAGGEISAHQWNDVIGVLRVQRENLDYPYLMNWAKRLGLTGLLERALQEAG